MHDDAIAQLRVMLNLGKRQVDRYYVTRLLEAHDHAVEQRGKAADYLLHISQEWAAEYDKAIRQRDYAVEVAGFYRDCAPVGCNYLVALPAEDHWEEMP